MTALLGALGKAVMLMNVKDPKANEFFQTAMPIFKKVVKKAYVDGNTELLTEFTSHFGQVTAIISGNFTIAYHHFIRTLSCLTCMTFERMKGVGFCPMRISCGFWMHVFN